MLYSYFLAEFENGSEKGGQGNWQTRMAYHHTVDMDTNEVVEMIEVKIW
jgi:hypothetical protein